MRGKKLVLRGGKRVYKKFSLQSIKSDSIFSKMHFSLKDTQIYNNKLIVSILNKKIHLYNKWDKLTTKISRDKEKEYPNWVSDTNVELNEYIIVRLIEGETHIYVAEELFSQCKYLLLNIPDTCISEQVNSIDEAEKYFSKELEGETESKPIPAKTEFLGHISNLQAWVENDYDTRILHRNLAFPLLKRLADVGDLKAKIKLKEEVIKRIETGAKNVILFILEGDYINDWTLEEMDVLISIPNLDLYTYYLIYIKIRTHAKIPEKFWKLKNLIELSFDPYLRNPYKNQELELIYPIIPDFFKKEEIPENLLLKLYELKDLYTNLEVWQKELEKNLSFTEKIKIKDVKDRSFVDEHNFFNIVFIVFTESIEKTYLITFLRNSISLLAKAEVKSQFLNKPKQLLDQFGKLENIWKIFWLEQHLNDEKIKYEVILQFEKELNDTYFFHSLMEDYIAYIMVEEPECLTREIRNILKIRDKTKDETEDDIIDDIIERNSDRWAELFPQLSALKCYPKFKELTIDEKFDDLRKDIAKQINDTLDIELIKKYLNLDSAIEDLIEELGGGRKVLSADNYIHKIEIENNHTPIYYWQIKDYSESSFKN